MTKYLINAPSCFSNKFMIAFVHRRYIFFFSSSDPSPPHKETVRFSGVFTIFLKLKSYNKLPINFSLATLPRGISPMIALSPRSSHDPPSHPPGERTKECPRSRSHVQARRVNGYKTARGMNVLFNRDSFRSN